MTSHQVVENLEAQQGAGYIKYHTVPENDFSRTEAVRPIAKIVVSESDVSL